MDLRQLEYLVAVAEELNFTRAASRCHIAQSGLSHQVRQLERELGTPMFERTSRSVRMTPAGSAFLPRARAILREAADARGDLATLKGQVHGTLRLGTIPFSTSDIDVLGLLEAFRTGYPAIDVVVRDDGSLSTVAAVLSGSLDLAFVGLFVDQMPDGLAHRLLSLHPLVAVVNQEHALAGHGTVDLSRLVDDGSGFLESHPDSGLRAQVDAACTRVKRRRHVVCELRNPAELVQLALHGMGVAVVPRPVAVAVVGQDSPSILRLTDQQAVQPITLVHLDPPPGDPAVQAFLRLVDARGTIPQGGTPERADRSSRSTRRE